MATIIDSSLWVDHFRPRTPLAVRQQILPWIDGPGGALCNPIRFEILGFAPRNERAHIAALFETYPVLADPAGLWRGAMELGQKCRDAGCQVHAMDLLIAHVCLAHEAELVTFDRHFIEIAKVCPLRLRYLSRAG